MYRGLEYHPVNTYADSWALRCERARVLSGANMGTRPRRLTTVEGPTSPSQNPDGYLNVSEL